MATRKKIEIFSAGCSTCKETIELVKRMAGSSHEVVIHDMHKPDIASKAKQQFRSAKLLLEKAVGTGPNDAGGHHGDKKRVFGDGPEAVN